MDQYRSRSRILNQLAGIAIRQGSGQLNRWKLFQTLGFRLAAWNTLVLLAACVLALFAVRSGMQLTLKNEAELLLREEVLELELAIKQLLPDEQAIFDEFERKVLGHSRHQWFAQLRVDDQIAWQSKNFPADFDQQFSTQTSPGTEFQAAIQRLVVVHKFQVKDGSLRAIVLGEPDQFIRTDVWQLTKIMLYIGAVLFLIAPVGGYLLAQRATKPVREIIATTRSLDPAHLSKRLSIRGTGDELDQISIEINSFVDQISNYVDAQRDFIANASHELRSPLASILASVDVTLSRLRSPEEYRENLITVGQKCRELTYLVNQLLELAENEGASFLPTEPVDLGSLVQRSIEVFRGIADEKRITFNCDLQTNLKAIGNPAKLLQVANNLIDNAVKFTPDSGTIEIRVFQRDQEVRLTITDSGPGVPESELEKIFERFYQADPARQRDKRRGNGIGLSICRSIVRRCDGKIVARNMDAGFRVELSLPLAN